jgi:hypothetical protein
MSSRSKRKGKSSSYYPTQWSEWTWSEGYQRNYRSRLNGPGTSSADEEGTVLHAEFLTKGTDDWEYEYEQLENVPRTFPALDPILEAPTSQYPLSSQLSGYTTAPLPGVDHITEELSQATLEQYSTPPWQNHIRTRNPNSNREEFDPREQSRDPPFCMENG